MMGGALGMFLSRSLSMFIRSVVPTAYGDKSKLTPEVHRQYFDALPTKDSRKGTWVFPTEIIDSSDWLTLFPAAVATRFPHTGHYVQDEEGEVIAPLIRDFTARYP